MSEATTPTITTTPTPAAPAAAAASTPDLAPAAAQPTPDGAAAPEGDQATTPSEDPRLGARFAHLARKEKEIRAEQARKEQELQAKEQSVREAEQRLAAFQDAERLAKEDPLAFIERYGVTLDTLIDRSLSLSAKDPAVSALEREVQDVKRRLEEERQAAERARDEERAALKRAQEEQVISGHKRAIRDAVDADPDRFELVRVEDAYDDVWDVIEEHFKQTLDPATGRGEVLSIEAAATLVEEYLTAEAKRLAQAKKLKALIGHEPDASKVGDGSADKRGWGGASTQPRLGAEGSAATSTPVTLTNGHVSYANPLPQATQLSAEESKRRSAALLKFK